MKNKLIFFGIAIVILILIGAIIYLGPIDNEEEFRVTILNTFNEKMKVECYIKQNAEKGYPHTGRAINLEPNESYTFHFKYDKLFNVYDISIRAINYTYYTHPEMHKKYILPDSTEYGIYRYNGHANYYFSYGPVHDLIAVIIPAPCGLNLSNIQDDLKYNIEDTDLTPVDIIITKMPEPPWVTTIFNN